MDKLVHVALKISHNNGVLTYLLPGHLGRSKLIGSRVMVSLRNQDVVGVIIDERPKTEMPKNIELKAITTVLEDKPFITEPQLELMRFCATYYFNPLGMVVHMAVPRLKAEPRKKEIDRTDSVMEREDILLSGSQSEVVQQILLEEQGCFLLEGVTGAGKTHVYMAVARKTLAADRSVLFLVPEISLTPQLIARVESILGVKACVIHSQVSPQKKFQTIRSLQSGKAKVLIGARSAIFAPMLDLGLIVVDEEHDVSLKQDESPRYHARDLALWRAKNEKARIILGSATPSLESIVNVRKNKLRHLFLHQRFDEGASLPKVALIDLKERARDVDHRLQDQSMSDGHRMCILSKPLVSSMKDCLSRGQQVLLFLNQRGYAKFGVCYQCGEMVKCPNCSISLTYYQRRHLLLCHQCQHGEVKRTTCHNCEGDEVKYLGLGTERLEEEVSRLFDEHRVIRLDRDVVRSQKRLNSTLMAMHERQADILIGTQMIAKGHDFKHVGLVGVICADASLSMPDFRAQEKTFQLLTQVAGRAGRGDFLGEVLIQSFNPQHPSIMFAREHDVKGFIEQELKLRQRFSLPPFKRAALVRCEHRDVTVAKEAIESAVSLLKMESRLSISGPAPSPIERINQRYRFQCLVMAREISVLHGALSKLASPMEFYGQMMKKGVRLTIDVDPQNLS